MTTRGWYVEMRSFASVTLAYSSSVCPPHNQNCCYHRSVLCTKSRIRLTFPLVVSAVALVLMIAIRLAKRYLARALNVALWEAKQPTQLPGTRTAELTKKDGCFDQDYRWRLHLGQINPPTCLSSTCCAKSPCSNGSIKLASTALSSTTC